MQKTSKNVQVKFATFLNNNIENFHSGHFEKGAGYSYFVPEIINKEWTWQTPALNVLLEKAATRIGELNAFSRLVPNVDLFIHLHLVKEAVVSSRIEGTRTNMDEALMPEGEIAPDRRSDWLEVMNYTKALNDSILQSLFASIEQNCQRFSQYFC